MKLITEEIKQEIRELVFNFFSEECEVDLEEINDETTILDDLDGDSLLFVELIELMKKKYDLDLKLQSVGKYLLKRQAKTIGEAIDITYLIYQYEDSIVDLGE